MPVTLPAPPVATRPFEEPPQPPDPDAEESPAPESPAEEPEE